MSRAFGDERDRVIVKSDGENTYLLGDIAYHRHKFEKQSLIR
jgi:Arginyl-tRNA synthetase